MPRFPAETDLSQSGAPFTTLASAQGFAADRALATGLRQHVTLRRVTGKWPWDKASLHRRWIVRPVECICEMTPERYWTTHYGAVEPGSQWEWNPDCRQHPREG